MHHSRQQHGIYHSNSGDRPLIRGNYCHDNAAIGIHMNGDASQGGDGLITGAVVENNLIVNNGTLGGAGINMDGVQGSIVRNNVLYGNHASGIAMFQIDGAQGPASNVICHNTIDMAADSRWDLHISETSGINLIRNNIFYQRNAGHGGMDFTTPGDAANTDSDYNLFGGACFITTNDNNSRVSLATWQAGGHELHSSCVEITNVVVAPLVDYHLRTNSPAINAGLTTGLAPVDKGNLIRPAGTTVDSGAYEFGGRMAVPPVTFVVAGSTSCLSFPTILRNTYQIERAPELSSNSWSVVTNGIVGTGDLLYFSDSVPGSNRFYRIRVTP